MSSVSLHTAVNVAAIQFLRDIYATFPTKSLHAELSTLMSRTDGKQDDPTLYNELKEDTSDIQDQLYDKDESALDKVRLLKRIKSKKLLARMNEKEKDMFWDRVLSIAKYTTMINAVSGHMDDIHKMAETFMQENKNMDLKDMQAHIFEELFAGGKMSEQFLQTFTKDGALDGVLRNVGNILRAPGDEAVDMSAMADALKKEDLSKLPEHFAKMKQHISDTGTNPMADIGKVLRDESETKGDSPIEPTKILASGGLSKSIKEIMKKAMEAKAQQEAEEASKKEEEAVKPDNNATVEEEEVTKTPTQEKSVDVLVSELD